MEMEHLQAVGKSFLLQVFDRLKEFAGGEAELGSFAARESPFTDTAGG
jgi:hypothetical protein